MERRANYELNVEKVRAFLKAYQAYSGGFPHAPIMEENVKRCGWRMGDTIEHLDWPGVELQIVGAFSRPSPYVASMDELYLRHSDASGYIHIVAKPLAGGAARSFPAGKLNKP